MNLPTGLGPEAELLLIDPLAGDPVDRDRKKSLWVFAPSRIRDIRYRSREWLQQP